MTDDERFTHIILTFPVKVADLVRVHNDAGNLADKARSFTSDKTMSEVAIRQLRAFSNAIGELIHVVGIIERDEDPDDDIPF